MNEKLLQNAIDSNFEFLQTDYSFRGPRLVRNVYGSNKIGFFCESRRVFIKIYYGPPGYELDFHFGRRGVEDLPGHQSFDLHDISRLLRQQVVGVDGPRYPEDVAVKAVERIAEFLRSHAKSLLEGDSAAFAEMQRLRGQAVARESDRRELSRVLQAADSEWSKKNFPGVIANLKPYEGRLKGSYLKKLRYAEKMVAKQ